MANIADVELEEAPQDYGAQVKAAIAAGYSKDEVWQHLLKHPTLGPQITSALSHGYERDDVLMHLGAMGTGQEPKYGAAQEAASAILAGQGPRVGAALSALTPGAPSYSEALPQLQAAQESYRKENPLTAAGIDVAGSVPLALGTGGVVSTASRAVPVAGRFLAGEAGGNLLTRAASQGTAGALQGGAFGALEGDPLGGAIGGAALGAAGAPILHAVTGTPLSPEVAGLAKKFVDMGIPLKTSNLTGTGKVTEGQSAAFTTALAKTFGTDLKPGEGLTPDVMSATADRIGKQLNDAAKGLSIDPAVKLPASFDGTYPAGQTLPDRLASMRGNIVGGIDPSRGQQLLKVIDAIDSKAATGPLSGEEYQKLTTKGSPLGLLLSAPDPAVRQAARHIRDTLDSGLEQTATQQAYAGGGMTASGTGLDDLALLKRSRQEWKNMLVAEDLAETAGPEGHVNPKSLLNKTRRFYPDFAYSGTPGSDLADLAKGGQEFLSGPTASNKLLTMPSPAAFKHILGAVAGAGLGEASVMHLMQDPSLALQAAAAATVPVLFGGARAIARSPNALIRRSLSEAPSGSFGLGRQAALPLAQRFYNALSPQ